MRYVSKFPNLILYSMNMNNELYRFRNGLLDLGSGNEIDPGDGQDKNTSLMRIYETDLSGKKEGEQGVKVLELCGLGDLTNKTTSQGIFFEAPVLDKDDGVSDESNIAYRVLTKSITYAGKEYFAGEIFFTDGKTTTVTGDGTYALEYVDPNSPADLRTEYFKINVLVDGTESPKYWTVHGGYKPTNSTNPTDDNFFGRMK